VHTTGVQRDFGVFYEKWLSKRLTHPAFTFLHETFRQYLKSQYKGGEVTNRLTPFRQTNQETTPAASYLTKGQARKALEIGEPVLQKLINQGKIRVHQKLMGPSAKRTLSLIEKQSVEALKLEWETLITLESVCKVHLGITKAVVLTLEEAELLLPTRGPKTDGYKQRYYHPQAMKDLEQLLLAHSVKRGDSWSEAIPLAAVSQQVGIRLVTLVKAVLDNQIMLLDRSVEEPLFQRFLLPRAEIAGYLERQRHHQREALALMNAREAALELGVSERVLCRWARKGLLERTTAGVDGKGPSLWFRRETLMTFRQTYLFTEEVAKELQVETHTVSKYVRKGFLHPITGRRTDEGGIRLLFRREEIENFRALNCAHPIRGR
jgi:DNA-binding transcriptional MerR regulator